MSDPVSQPDYACICGHTGRKHHRPEQPYPFTCSLCSCISFEVPPLADGRPVDEQMADAIRCTTHIEDRRLRALYILKDMELRGFVIQRVARDRAGRFIKPVYLQEPSREPGEEG